VQGSTAAWKRISHNVHHPCSGVLIDCLKDELMPLHAVRSEENDEHSIIHLSLVSGSNYYVVYVTVVRIFAISLLLCV
jgi:hypothetical protein